MAKPKKIEGLDCAGGAAEGVRLTLASRFAEVLAYREAALDFSDIEGVHDMRVASRRLRSALRDFAPRLRRSRRLGRSRDELKTLARVLGAVRDQDVALAALEKLERDAPEEARAGLRLLAAGREALREEARARLTEALAAEASEELRRRFERAVAEAEWAPPERRRRDGDAGEGGEAEETFAELGRQVVARLWDELRELSPSLYRPHKERRLHRMRIAAKRLRYALELYSACWGDGAKELASEISDLQDAIGHLHDCDEWIAEVGERLARTADGAGGGTARADEEARPGLVWLLDHFAAERATNYREALRLWHEWERGGFAGRIAEVSQK